MTRIEQFVYTTTTHDVRSGYHVVARSPGITDKIISELDTYMLPAGVDPQNFGQSKSLVLIGNGTHVAYRFARNIGHGPDGRPNAMLSHTLVIDVKSFGDLSYDSRKLDSLFSHFAPLHPLLPSVSIVAGADSPPDPDFVKTQTPLLTRTLYTLLRGNSVAIRGACDEQFVQAALGLLPPRLRLVPFSTCAVDLELQPAYRFVLLGDSPATNSPKGFETIGSNSHLPFGDADLGRAVRYMVAMASVGSPHLAALHAEFDKIGTLSPRKRIALLTAVLRMAQSPEPMQSGRDVRTVVDHLASLDSHTWNKVMSRLGSGMRLCDRSELIDMIKTKSVHYNISNYNVTRKSIEVLLGQVRIGQRQELLCALYKSRTQEFHDKIDQLFEDFCYSYYGTDFFRFVASTPDLACRVKRYVGMDEKNPFRRQAVVRLFIRASLEHGSTSSIEPAIFKPYDLSGDYDLASFESLLSEVFSSSSAAQDTDFCAAVATAGLSYMEGFGQSYIPAPTWMLHRRAERFGALADRLGRVAMTVRGPTDGNCDGSKASREIAQPLRECGIGVPRAGD